MLVISSELTPDYHDGIEMVPGSEAELALKSVFERPETHLARGSFQNINHNCFHEINNLVKRGG